MAQPDSHLAIGIMSGTSADGIDAALLKIKTGNRFEIVAKNTLEFPTEVQQTIRTLNQSGAGEIESSGRLSNQLAKLYFETLKPLLQETEGQPVEVIGCHGQTVRHRPNISHPFTLQLGNGALLAQLTGIPSVVDFRAADIAVGGQGAPLAPGFHHAAFRSSVSDRAIVNIGGISNVTYLPSDKSSAVVGFDTGPGNTLLDHWTRKYLNAEYDVGGEWAKSGKVSQSLLQRLMRDSYFHQTPPKSTGLEHFNLDWLDTMLQDHGEQHTMSLAPVDVQSTLVELTAKTIADQLPPTIDKVYVCGGGANNSFILTRLQCHTTAYVTTTSELGIDPQWVECAAFAWMAYQTLNRQPSTIPSVTGATKPTVAGAVYWP